MNKLIVFILLMLSIPLYIMCVIMWTWNMLCYALFGWLKQFQISINLPQWFEKIDDNFKNLIKEIL